MTDTITTTPAREQHRTEFNTSEASQHAGHTPGPWTVEEEPCDSYRDVYGATGDTVARVEAWDGEGCEAAPEAAANARLIAAAPELLAALEALLPYAKNEIGFINIRSSGSGDEEAEADKANDAYARAEAALSAAKGLAA